MKWLYRQTLYAIETPYEKGLWSLVIIKRKYSTEYYGIYVFFTLAQLAS